MTLPTNAGADLPPNTAGGHDEPDAARRGSRRRDLGASAWTAVTAAAVLVFLYRYNHQNAAVWAENTFGQGRSWDEYLLVNIAALVFPPLLVVLCVLRMPASRFGIRPPVRSAWRIALLFFVVMLPVIWLAARSAEFRTFYPLQHQAAVQWRYFWYFELTYGFYLFCWEMFFRGFVTFGLARSLGPAAAIGVQAVAFGVMHAGKPGVEMASSFVGGAILGWLALRARSFAPGFCVHWGVAVALDCMAIHVQRGTLF